MNIRIPEHQFTEVSSLSSNVANTARIILRTPLDDFVPEALWGNGEIALRYLNQKNYNNRYELCPYHYIIDSNGEIFQNRMPEVTDSDPLIGYLEDIEIFILTETMEGFMNRSLDNPLSKSINSSLTVLVSYLSEQYNIILTDSDKNFNFLISRNSFLSSSDSFSVFSNLIRSAIIYRNSENQLYSVCENVMYPQPLEAIEFTSIPSGYYELDVSYPYNTNRLLLKFTDQNGKTRFLYPGVDYNELPAQSSENESNAVHFLNPIAIPGTIDVIVLSGFEKIYQNLLIRPIKIIPNLDYIQRLMIGLKLDPAFFEKLNGHINFHPTGLKINASYNGIVFMNTIAAAITVDDDITHNKIGVYEREIFDRPPSFEDMQLLNSVNRVSRRLTSILAYIPKDVLYSYEPYIRHITKECRNMLIEVEKYIL